MSDKKTEYPKDYIGDGVYVLSDGFGIWLHANHHENPTDRVYLEPDVFIGLVRFALRLGWDVSGVVKKEMEELGIEEVEK